MPKTLLAVKVAEWWQGGPIASFNSFDCDQGKILEDSAIPWVEFTYGVKVQRVGLITDDKNQYGASPDGLIGEDMGLECKCPTAVTHTKYLLAGKVPAEYLAQIQGGLLITQRKAWRFVSYCRRMPALVIDVKPDEEFQEALAGALSMFLAQFEAAKKRLIELNGGPPKRHFFTPKPQEFVSELPS